MKKVALITGAEGFVGGHLATALLSNGYQVFGTALNEKDLIKAVPGEQMIKLDISDKVALSDAINKIKPDVVFHLAAISSVALSWKNPYLTFNVNVNGTLSLLDCLRAAKPNCKVILIGSSEEYGIIDYTNAVKESTPLNPQNIYAITKQAQENIGKLYAKAYGMNIVMTRSFNHFGSGQAIGFVIADFCNQVAKIEKGLQEPVMKVGNLSAARDFIYIDDVIKAYLLLAEKGQSGEIYNVGSGYPRKVADILKLIVSKSTKKIAVEIDQSKFRPIDVPIIKADISKISALGFKITSDFDSSLEDTLNYYRENLVDTLIVK